MTLFLALLGLGGIPRLAAAHLGLGRAQDALELAEEAVGLAAEHRWPYPETVASLTLSRVLRSLHGPAAAATAGSWRSESPRRGWRF